MPSTQGKAQVTRTTITPARIAGRATSVSGPVREGCATRHRTSIPGRNPAPESGPADCSARISRMARTKSSKPARAEQPSGEDAPNPVWFKPVMFGFMLLGLLWIIVFYVSQGALPVAALGSWNILIGFGIAFVGFLMTTRWR